MKQQFENYTKEDFLVWKTLFKRQVENLNDKSCIEYLNCLKELESVLNAESIPKFSELNKVLKQKTGWTIEVVPGLIPVNEFFELLAQKKFCSSTWLRSMKQLDYLEEPDMFHDVFGHIPLFMNNEYADFAQKMGQLGVKHSGNEIVLIHLQRLYWFTIEFGLIEQNGLKLYGAGIMSSFGESNFVYTNKPEKVSYNLEVLINTHFCNSEIQTKYFVINSFKSLYDSIDDYVQLFSDNQHLKIKSI
jgi:phenylalanine-4-hydroxylase